jgi:hypothetical protein
VQVFGDGSWRYPHTAPGKLKCKGKRSSSSPEPTGSSSSKLPRKFGGGLWEGQSWTGVGKGGGHRQVISRAAAGGPVQSSAAASGEVAAAGEEVGEPLLLPGGEDNSKQKRKKPWLSRLSGQVGGLVRPCFGACMG